jgi:hypothetical protein
MEPEARHWAPWAPRSSWDGWFAIGIFPANSRVRWVKAHFFRRACGATRHPLASVEGMDASSEMLLVHATTDGQTAYRRAVDPDALAASHAPFQVALPGRFRFAGEPPRFTMDFALPEDGATARFAFEGGWPIWWARAGRFLHYVGRHAAARVELADATGARSLAGLGVMEHVCGASTGRDVTERLPLHFHWDVLAFHTPGSPLDSAAGLALMRRGKTCARARAAGRLPGYGAMTMKGLAVRYLAVTSALGPDGTRLPVPDRWEGVLRHRHGVLRYEATRSTPLAPLVPGGGMLGFDFTGEWKPAGSAAKTWTGTGFTEVGDFAGQLIALAK